MDIGGARRAARRRRRRSEAVQCQRGTAERAGAAVAAPRVSVYAATTADRERARAAARAHERRSSSAATAPKADSKQQGGSQRVAARGILRCLLADARRAVAAEIDPLLPLPTPLRLPNWYIQACSSIHDIPRFVCACIFLEGDICAPAERRSTRVHAKLAPFLSISLDPLQVQAMVSRNKQQVAYAMAQARHRIGAASLARRGAAR